MRWNSRNTPEGQWMGGLGWMCAGVVVMIWGAWSCWDGFLSRGWPTAEGTVTISRLSQGSRGPTVWFTYQYTVNRHPYESSRFDTSAGTASAEIVAKNPAGTPVQVHYDPADPAHAVLVPGVRTGHLLTLVLGLALVLAGGWRWRSASSEIAGEGNATGKLYRSGPKG